MRHVAVSPPRTTAYLWGLIGLLLAQEAGAQAMSLDRNGVAIRGYDAVAYVTQQKAIKGSAEHSADYQGATYWFASAADREAFLAEPDRFVPAYGGFCAYGVSQGHKVSIDPEAFSIVDGRLYLNYSKGVRERWRKDVPGNITKADRNWPGLRDQPSD